MNAKYVFNAYFKLVSTAFAWYLSKVPCVPWVGTFQLVRVCVILIRPLWQPPSSSTSLLPAQRPLTQETVKKSCDQWPTQNDPPLTACFSCHHGNHGSFQRFGCAVMSLWMDTRQSAIQTTREIQRGSGFISFVSRFLLFSFPFYWPFSIIPGFIPTCSVSHQRLAVFTMNSEGNYRFQVFVIRHSHFLSTGVRFLAIPTITSKKMNGNSL